MQRNFGVVIFSETDQPTAPSTEAVHSIPTADQVEQPLEFASSGET